MEDAHSTLGACLFLRQARGANFGDLRLSGRGGGEDARCAEAQESAEVTYPSPVVPPPLLHCDPITAKQPKSARPS